MRGPDGGPAGGSLTELAALEAARDEKRQLLDRAAEAARSELGGRSASRGLHGRRPARPPAALLLERAGRRGPRARARGARRAGAGPPEARRGAPARLGHRRRAAPARRPRRHPPGHRRHALPRRLGHRRGRPAGRHPRPHRAPGRRRPPRPARPDQGLLRQLARRSAAAPTRSPSPGWPSSSTARWTTRPPPTWSPACAPCWTTSAPSTRTPNGCVPACWSWPAASTSWPSGLPRAGADPADDPAEAAALLRWLADGNFVFLGARDVDLVASRGKPPPAPSTAPGSASCAATPT